jgi:hypothetical protein
MLTADIVLRRFAAGPWAVIEWTMSGTNRGEWAGMPVTGRRFASVRGVALGLPLFQRPR